MQGPLQSLVIDSIAWGSAARPDSTEAGSASGGSANAAQARAWLPIRITGVRVVLSGSTTATTGTAGGKRKQQGHRRRQQPNVAAKAAARPAVSTILAVARRLLPGLPVTVHHVVLHLEVCARAGRHGSYRGWRGGRLSAA